MGRWGHLATEQEFVTFLRGRANVAPVTPSASMPNFSAKSLPDKQANDIYAYIRSFKSTAPEKDAPRSQRHRGGRKERKELVVYFEILSRQMSSASFRQGGTNRLLVDVQERVYAPGSSMATSYFIVAVGAGVFFDHVQLLGVRMPGVVQPRPSLKPMESTTSVLPSQWPIAWPSQLGFGSFVCARPSIHTWRHTCAPPSYRNAIRLDVCTISMASPAT